MLGRFKWLLSAVLLFVALVLLSISGRNPGQHSSMAFVVLELVAPLEKIFTSSARGVENVWRAYFSLVGLRQENEKLKQTIDRQTRQITQLNEYKVTNDRLTTLLEFKTANPDFFYVPAMVLAWDPGPWFRSIIISAGSDDGLTVDQAVVHPRGVVGRVVEVTPRYARVLLASDFNSSIDAFIQNNRASGILSGQGGKPFYLKYVRKDEDVRLGDQVVSSGLDGIFPKGLALGTVSYINRKSADMFVEVEVAPAVDFSRLEEVLVVLNNRPEVDWLSLGPSLRPLLEAPVPAEETPGPVPRSR